MYIEDDICYVGNPGKDVKVVEATPLSGGMMILLFSTGELKLFDATQLKGGAFDVLKDPTVFDAPHVEHGFVSWADGAVDVAPEYMYENSVAYNRDDDLLFAG